MGKAFGLLLVLAGLAAEALFLLTGAGTPRAGPIAEALGPAAGSLHLALGGAAAFLLGTLLLARGGAERPLAWREALLVLVVGAAAAFTVAALVGVGREWRPETLAALLIGAASETLVAVGLSVRIAMLAERRKLLFVPGVVGATLVGVVQLLIITLGA
jgi:hypothetical protein